jgi:hypothetical protein
LLTTRRIADSDSGASAAHRQRIATSRAMN